MYFTPDTNILEDKLEIFRDCFSKPQWNHFTTYTTGLIVSEKGEKNIQDIANNNICGKSQSSLNRFITNPKWMIGRINNIRLREYLSRKSRVGGFLSLDDSILEKTGQNMEGTGYLYDPASKQNVLCHNIVSTYYTNGKFQLPLHFETYIKEDVADSINVHFKTKIQLGIQLLNKALTMGIKPEAILTDAWNFSKDIIQFANSCCLTLVSQARSNRCILVDDNWVQLKNFYHTIPHENFKRIDETIEENQYKWYYATNVTMKNAGCVRVVILKKRKNGKRFKVLVTNNCKLLGITILKYYKVRWDIEVFYRDCKQHLGLEEYQMRKLDAVVIHLHLVFLLYTLLKNVWCNSLLQKILKGIKRIGTACNRIKRYIFEQIMKTSILSNRKSISI